MITKLIKVASKSDVKSVGGSIALALKENDEVEVQAIGAFAVNQAIKSIASARSHLTPENTDLNCVPSFKIINENDMERTAINFRVKKVSV